jgi:hypothetical protein
MEDAKGIAVASYKQVLEDCPEFCSSESEAEYSDHREKWADDRTYTPAITDEKGNRTWAGQD